MSIDELPEEEEWFCKQCTADRTVSRGLRFMRALLLLIMSTQPKFLRLLPPEGVFGLLIKQAEVSNPTEFRLPNNIRQTFANGM